VPPTDPELLLAGDLNLAESVRHLVREAPGGVIEEADGLLLVSNSSHFPGPWNNGAFRVDSRLAPADVLARAGEFFGRLGRAYCLWLRDHVPEDLNLAAAAKDAGLVDLGISSPQMVLDAPLAASGALDADITVDHVDNERARAAYVDVTAAAYEALGQPPQVAHEVLARLPALHGPKVRAVVARVDGEPAAAAMLTVSHCLGCVGLVGTVPHHRRRGLAELVTRRVGNAAFALGAWSAVLQASPMGEPLYQRMGYREVTRYRFLLGSPG